MCFILFRCDRYRNGAGDFGEAVGVSNARVLQILICARSGDIIKGIAVLQNDDEVDLTVTGGVGLAGGAAARNRRSCCGDAFARAGIILRFIDGDRAYAAVASESDGEALVRDRLLIDRMVAGVNGNCGGNRLPFGIAAF